MQAAWLKSCLLLAGNVVFSYYCSSSRTFGMRGFFWMFYCFFHSKCYSMHMWCQIPLKSIWFLERWLRHRGTWEPAVDSVSQCPFVCLWPGHVVQRVSCWTTCSCLAERHVRALFVLPAAPDLLGTGSQILLNVGTGDITVQPSKQSSLEYTTKDLQGIKACILVYCSKWTAWVRLQAPWDFRAEPPIFVKENQCN